MSFLSSVCFSFLSIWVMVLFCKSWLVLTHNSIFRIPFRRVLTHTPLWRRKPSILTAQWIPHKSLSSSRFKWSSSALFKATLHLIYSMRFSSRQARNNLSEISDPDFPVNMIFRISRIYLVDKECNFSQNTLSFLLCTAREIHQSRLEHKLVEWLNLYEAPLASIKSLSCVTLRLTFHHLFLPKSEPKSFCRRSKIAFVTGAAHKHHKRRFFQLMHTHGENKKMKSAKWFVLAIDCIQVANVWMWMRSSHWEL